MCHYERPEGIELLLFFNHGRGRMCEQNVKPTVEELFFGEPCEIQFLAPALFHGKRADDQGGPVVQGFRQRAARANVINGPICCVQPPRQCRVCFQALPDAIGEYDQVTHAQPATALKMGGQRLPVELDIRAQGAAAPQVRVHG